MWDKFQGLRPPQGLPRAPQGHSIPKRIQEGRDPWILSDPNLRLGLLMLWRLGLWILFLSYLRLGIYFIFRWLPAPFSLGPTYTLDWKGKKNNLDWWIPLQNWHQTVTKVHEIYCVEHCWHVYQAHRYKFPHLETLWFVNFEMKILNLTQTKRLPNPVLLLFPDSCFDLAGRSLKEKNKK